MAKEDFCFIYYDGDAARDKAHMKRLERGAYDDIISAQRKRGHLSLDDIKRVLSDDFATCWEALEWVLKKDENGKYFIEWVDSSVEKMRAGSQKQKDRVSKRWNKGDGITEPIPKTYRGNTVVIPKIVNGNENESENEVGKEEKGGTEEKETRLMPDETTTPENLYLFELTVNDIHLTQTYLSSTCFKEFKDEKVKAKWLDGLEIERQWTGFKIQYFTSGNEYENWADVMQHFRDWLKRSIQKQEKENAGHSNGNSTGSKQAGSHGKSTGAIKLAQSLAADLRIPKQ